MLAATIGNVDANLQDAGIQRSNDVRLSRRQRMPFRETRTAEVAVATLTLLAAMVAAGTLHSTGLNESAILSYQGIVQPAHTLLLGISWRRGTATCSSPRTLTTSLLCT